MGAYENLLNQIDQFIRKYYKNEMVMGLLFFIVTLVFTFLLITSLEYFGRFNSIVRGTLLFTFIGLNSYIFIYYFLRSLLKLLSFGKQISRHQAAKIIGVFFPDISDRLLNTLQLSDDTINQTANLELIRASVSQRSSSLSSISFSSAINIKKNNKKYFIYLLPLLFVFILVSSFLPQFFTQSAERVVYFKQQFKPTAPFTFNLSQNTFTLEEGGDLNIDLTLHGQLLPEKVYLVCSQGTFLMRKDLKNKFFYLLPNIRSSSVFYFTANQFESSNFKINVIGKAVLRKLSAHISYPSYLGMSNQLVDNIGDIVLPEGSVVNWDVLSDNTSFVDVFLYGKMKHFTNKGFSFQTQFNNSTNVFFILNNEHDGTVDSTQLTVTVLKDAYPIISLERKQDSLSSSLSFFSGFVSDDYGLSNLSFNYIVKSDTTEKKFSLPVQSVIGTSSNFLFSFDFLTANLNLKDHVDYYFTVTDNDALHGGKTTKSLVYTYESPSLEELNDNRDDVFSNVQSNLSTIMDKSLDFKENINRLKKDILNNKSSDYNKLLQIKHLKEDQKDLKSLLESVQNDLEQSSAEMNELSELDESLSEKQDLINDLLDEVMDDELMELLEKLEDLIKKNNSSDDQKKNVDDIEMNADDMNKQLDRSIEMLKKLQVNEKVDAIENELDALAKEQDLNKKDFLEDILSKEDVLKKQNEIDNRFDEIKEDLEVLNKLNEDLENPMDLGDPQELQESIDNDLQKALEQINKSKSSKASESQQNASDGMKKMSKDLNEKQKESNKQQQEEDISTLRMILKNLLTVSFDQEKVMDDFIHVNDNSLLYNTYARMQQKIMDNSLNIRDSLNALSKRQPKIATFIDKELNSIFKNFSFITEDIDEHRRRPLSIHQQTVMSSFNLLALLLNESLESMQSQMNSDKPGSGSCSNPGMKGKPKSGKGQVGDIKDMIKKQLDQMEKGNKLGGSNPVGSSPSPFGMSSKDFSKMAAQQSLIRKKLESLKNDLNKDGKGRGNQLNGLLKELEEQEKDLINKKFTPAMIKRQQNILTRLLESEDALTERGMDDKRESKSGKVFENGNQFKFEEYKKEKLKEIEFFRSIDPLYQKYYKDKANEYFNKGI